MKENAKTINTQEIVKIDHKTGLKIETQSALAAER